MLLSLYPRFSPFFTLLPSVPSVHPVALLFYPSARVLLHMDVTETLDSIVCQKQQVSTQSSTLLAPQRCQRAHPGKSAHRAFRWVNLQATHSITQQQRWQSRVSSITIWWQSWRVQTDQIFIDARLLLSEGCGRTMDHVDVFRDALSNRFWMESSAVFVSLWKRIFPLFW